MTLPATWKSGRRHVLRRCCRPIAFEVRRYAGVRSTAASHAAEAGTNSMQQASAQDPQGSIPRRIATFSWGFVVPDETRFEGPRHGSIVGEGPGACASRSLAPLRRRSRRSWSWAKAERARRRRPTPATCCRSARTGFSSPVTRRASRCRSSTPSSLAIRRISPARGRPRAKGSSAKRMAVRCSSTRLPTALSWGGQEMLARS